MRVGVDGRSLARPGSRGIARYTSTMVEALGRLFPEDEWKILIPGGRELSPLPGTSVRQVPVPSRLLYGVSALASRPRLDRLLAPLDVFWAPAPAPFSLTAKMPLVLTVHDLSWELRPGDFTGYERLWHRLARPQRLASRAQRVVAVSERTRQQAVARWALEDSRTSTIYQGVASPGRSGDDAPLQADDREGAVGDVAGPDAADDYFLFVGDLEPRKAPELLAAAFARARRRGLRCRLLVAGGGRLESAFADSGARLLGRVSDATLARLYADAYALVMPSREEGFGLPPLEAARLAVPSILSDLPIFAETLGEASVRVPVGDEEALADALLQLESEPHRRNELGKAAQERAARYAPDHAARELRDVLAAAAGEQT